MIFGAVHSLVPVVDKKYQKKQKNKNLIPTSAKRQNRGIFAFFLCELLDTC
jgi:hypothetical protein